MQHSWLCCHCPVRANVSILDHTWTEKYFENHLEGVRRVLKALQQHGVKLRPTKCELFKPEVRYVGRLVSAGGVRIDPRDINAVLTLREKTPNTVGEVWKLLGFLSYRTYIQDFSRIAKPI